MTNPEPAGFTAAQAAGLLQIHGDIGPVLLDGMDEEQRAALPRLHAELFLTMTEAAALAAEADEATGNGKARKRRSSVLAPRQ